MKEKKLKQLNLSEQQEQSKLSEEKKNNSKLISREEYDIFELLKFENKSETYIALGNNIVLETENEKLAKKAIDNRDYKLLLNLMLTSYDILNNLNE